MKRYWTGILGQVQAFQRRFLRDKVSLFFTFLFPLIFLFVFGSIFKNQTVNFKVGIINHSHSQFAQQFVDNATKGKDSVLKVKDVKGLDDAKEKMKRSQIDGIIELPKDFGEQGPDGKPRGTIKVLYSKGSDQAGSTLTAVMNQTTNGVNKALGQPDAPIKVSSNAVGDEALSSFDYTFTGLLTFSLMSMGIFGLANTMPAEKKRGSYRRLRAAPFSPAQLIIASGIHYLVVALLSVATMFLVGTFVFHFKMRGDWLVFFPFLLLSAVAMIGLGLTIGGWAKNENQSSVLTNVVAMPLMFLSGVFFPVYLFPDWLQGVTKFVPVYPMVEGFRLVMTEHAGFGDIALQFGLVGLWVVVVYGAAIKLFRWE